ncbi:parathyroid hormone/parathyroid hormone-related peptide receptor, partial [Aplysia californica]|uniref:Parathyroid hormone/parathyroid hormone-related peptide receptor n=1 Tax=Aplysia californica TaxID=6500 RepID=A0ABM1ABW6_APLCA
MVKPRAVSRLTHTSRRTRACPCLKPTPRRAHTSSSVFLMLLLTQTTAMIGAVGTAETAASVVNISADDQNARIEYEQIRCLDYFDSQPATSDNGSFCPRVWDSLLCWPDTPAGVVAVQPCPDYVQGFKPWENATRECREDGTWYFDAHHNRSWTDYSFCTNRDPDVPVETAGDFVKAHMDRIRLMYNVGYGISLVSLVLSVFIMIGFKKLHCPRNTIHLNLFFSFILRASFSFMKENLLVQGLGFPSDVTRPSEDGPFIFKNGSTHWECKLFFTCFHYILGANYMWISAEALYLHILISVAVFSERSTIKWYILCGWGSPMLFVLPWVIVRAILEDVYCWNTHPTPGYFWIMRGPIVLSIVVNFVFFLNIVRVLFTKLNAVNSPEAKKFRYRKLAKSTLVLIPLFGVHYIVFAGLPKDVNPTAELIQL